VVSPLQLANRERRRSIVEQIRLRPSLTSRSPGYVAKAAIVPVTEGGRTSPLSNLTFLSGNKHPKQEQFAPGVQIVFDQNANHLCSLLCFDQSVVYVIST